MQTAWILTLPPFRGLDEFDHAYRAAAVAHGEWLPDPVSAANGRGELVTVPRTLVEAAGPVCNSYDYTGPENCAPVTDAGDGMVTVASGAARYNPAFYWVMGTAARPFEGSEALYVMRLTAALLCAAFIALAGWSVSLWSRTRWPMVAILVALSPVAVYSTALAAPNGIEMSAGLALWTTLLGLSRPGLSPKVQRALILAAVPCAVVLSTVRLLGVMWLGLIVLCAAALIGLKGARALWARQRRSLLVAVGIVTSAVLTSLLWLVVSSQNTRGQGGVDHADPITNSLKAIPVWFIQSIAAFPALNELAPVPVYVIGTTVFLGILYLGLRLGSGRQRVVLLSVVALAVAIPVAATVATYTTSGLVWQGRYGLPLAFGIVLLVGLVLETRLFAHPLTRPHLLVGVVALAVEQTIGIVHVLGQERRESPLSGDPAWLMPSPWLVGALMVGGWLVCVAAARAQPVSTSSKKSANLAAPRLAKAGSG